MDGPFPKGAALLFSGAMTQWATQGGKRGTLLEARWRRFPDEVIAVIIGVMVVDLKTPWSAEPGAAARLLHREVARASGTMT